MPLPKEYYDILRTGDKPLTSPIAPSGLYPDLTPDITEDAGSAWGSVGDFMWQFGAGGISGLTWGVAELAAPSKPWEEMSGAEKSGWILGEGASLFAPWGPFGLLGKGSKLAAKGANKFIGKAAQEAAETGIARLTKKQATAVAAAQAKGVNFSDDIDSGLNMQNMVEEVKIYCTQIGLNPGTDKYADCSIKLLTAKIESQKQIVQQVSSGMSGTVTINDPSRDTDLLMKRSMGLINGTCTMATYYDC